MRLFNPARDTQKPHCVSGEVFPVFPGMTVGLYVILAPLMLSLICVEFGRAQQESCREQTVPVSVYDSKGLWVPDLAPADFEGSYLGKSIRVSSVSPEQGPHRVMLVLDTSGSMGDSINNNTNFPIACYVCSVEPPNVPPGAAQNWSFPILIARDLLTQIPPDTEIGIEFFSGSIRNTLLPTTDHKKLMDELATLRSRKDLQGPTALWDAIHESVNLFGSSHVGVGDAVYVITDGRDNASRWRPQDVSGTLRGAGIRLFAFELHSETRVAMMRERPQAKTLQQIVQDTGGLRMVYAEDDGALVDRSGKPTQRGRELDNLYRQILHFHLLTIDLPGAVNDRQDWTLALTGTAKTKSRVLVYPHALTSCAPASVPK
jgi:hypothetical protein